MLSREVLEKLAREAFGPNAQIVTDIHCTTRIKLATVEVDVYPPAPRSGVSTAQVNGCCLFTYEKVEGINPDNEQQFVKAFEQVRNFIKARAQAVGGEVKDILAAINRTPEFGE